MGHSRKPWAEHSRRNYNWVIGGTAAMAEGLGRNTELLEIQEVSAWRQQFGVAMAGLFSAGPIGLIASLIAFLKLERQWFPWALIGALASPPLAYGQWLVVQRISAPPEGGDSDLAALSISEADKAARACALALRTRGDGGTIRNPVDVQELFCDPSNPSTVVIPSTAHQLGRPDYCAEERALLARDQINQP